VSLRSEVHLSKQAAEALVITPAEGEAAEEEKDRKIDS